MFNQKEHVFGVTLQRLDRNTPWGIRIVGGADSGTPIIVTRAVAGSPCDGKLMKGDEIKKIGDYDARDIRHQDALNLFQNAGTTIKIDVKRDPNAKVTSSTNGFVLTPTSSRPQSSLSSYPSRPLTPVTPKTVIYPPPFPFQNEADTPLHDGYHVSLQDDDKGIENVKNQNCAVEGANGYRVPEKPESGDAPSTRFIQQLIRTTNAKKPLTAVRVLRTQPQVFSYVPEFQEAAG